MHRLASALPKDDPSSGLIAGMIIAQALLWAGYFAFGRSTNAGLNIIIPNTLYAVLAIVALIWSDHGPAQKMIWIILSFSAVVVAFSQSYYAYGTNVNFTAPLSRLDAIYFAVGTLTTAGTGNIAAISESMRGLQLAQMIIDTALMIFAITLAIPYLVRHSRTGR